MKRRGAARVSTLVAIWTCAALAGRGGYTLEGVAREAGFDSPDDLLSAVRRFEQEGADRA